MPTPPQDGDKADWAAAMLSADIISGALKPGDKLSEPQLAKRLGISRAPLREAIRRLEGRRLVTRKAKIGVHVAAFSTQDFVGLLHVREGLEGIAARLAALNIDEGGLAELRELCELYQSRLDDRAGMLDADVAFHSRIAQASGSAIIASMLCDDFYPSFRIWRRSYPRHPDRTKTALHQHLAIVDALAARDAEHAEYLMRHHVRTSREAFLAVVRDELPGSPSAAEPKARSRKSKRTGDDMAETSPKVHSPQALAELAPSGRLRAAVAVGEAASAVWNIRDPATGELRGVAADVVRAMEPWLGIPVDVLAFKSSATIIEAADGDLWDVGCTPVDAERKKKVEFSTDYYLGDSTYMVRAGVPATTVEEVDRPGMRIIGIEGTATLRAARASLKNVSAQGLAELADALARFGRGEADAVALSRESIISLLPKFPGARAVDDWFLATGTAIAVPKNRPLALALVTEFVEQAKQDGTLRAIFDRNNMAHVAVPPAGSQS